MSYHAGFLDIHRPEAYLADEMRQSMVSRPRALPLGMSLDAVGHALYARVTSLPRYALARAELELLRIHRSEILDAADRPREIIDLESGTSTQSRVLLGDVERYVAVEMCRAVLDDAVDGLTAAYPGLTIRGIVGDPSFGLGGSPHDMANRLVLLLGSTLGRLDPTGARLELARLRSMMEPDDRLLIGMDLAKEDSRLGEAYEDSTDVLAAYYRNAMRRSNREVGTDFRSADWNLTIEPQPRRGRIEVRFEAIRGVTVAGGKAGGEWRFEASEPLVVERAYKPSEGQVAAMALGAGFGVSCVWSDPAQGYALFMLVP